MMGFVTSEGLSDERIREEARRSLFGAGVAIPSDAAVVRDDDEMSPAAYVEAEVAGLPNCALYLWVSLEDVHEEDPAEDGVAMSDYNRRTA